MSTSPVNYPTPGKKTVTWTVFTSDSNPASPMAHGKWKCSGCHVTGSGNRSEASQHAQGCHAA